MKIDADAYKKFHEAVAQHQEKPREMPWRVSLTGGVFDPYHILVSEFMLQQTQVNRVIPKFELFIKRFPTIKALSDASLHEVLSLWSGLGYNRRAKYLHDASKALARNAVEWSVVELTACKGIGENTAKAIRAYAYNQPEVFIETNIRTVYIHHFFDEKGVSDNEISELLKQTIDLKNPREFYWALMDYGTVIKKTHGNSAQLSSGYRPQSMFEGSRRQLRGAIIKRLSTSRQSFSSLSDAISDERFEAVFADLVSEGLVELENKQARLAK